MLYQVSNKWKCGFMEDFIAHSNSGYTIDSPQVKTSFVKVFRYEVKSILKPGIAILQGKKFITPGFIPCHPKTELSDIKWIQKISKQEQVKEIDTWKFKSSSGDGEYVTKRNGFKFSCNCSGFYRAKDREKGCKHVQQVKKDLGL
jgi:hypothetical protein